MIVSFSALYLAFWRTIFRGPLYRNVFANGIHFADDVRRITFILRHISRHGDTPREPLFTVLLELKIQPL